MVPILTYHSLHVAGDTYDTNDHVALRSDLEMIARKGLRVCSLSEVAAAVETGDLTTLAGAVAITFDDGTDFDFHDLPHPTWGPQRSMFAILAEHARLGMPIEATAFAIVSPEARKELDRKVLMGKGWWNDDWWQHADGSGLMRVESHSWDHNHERLDATVARARPGTFRVSNFDDADAEIRAANSYLCARRGRAGSVMFAYPYGEASRYVALEYLARGTAFHGVRAAFTTEGVPVSRGVHPWLIPRFVFRWHWNSPGELEAILNGAPVRRRDRMELALVVRELPDVPEEANRLFRRSFRASPPTQPRHFAAFLDSGESRTLCGYVHFTPFAPGVFLAGGLCVDARIYRRLMPEQRQAIAKHGSLSRLLLQGSIAQLGPKRAVFACTGNTMSRRDTTALGFVTHGDRYLIVQWHDEPSQTREAWLQIVRGLEPF